MEMKNEPASFTSQKISWEKSLQKYNSHKSVRSKSHIADTRFSEDVVNKKKVCKCRTHKAYEYLLHIFPCSSSYTRNALQFCFLFFFWKDHFSCFHSEPSQNKICHKVKMLIKQKYREKLWAPWIPRNIAYLLHICILILSTFNVRYLQIVREYIAINGEIHSKTPWKGQLFINSRFGIESHLCAVVRFIIIYNRKICFSFLHIKSSSKILT